MNNINNLNVLDELIYIKFIGRLHNQLVKSNVIVKENYIEEIDKLFLEYLNVHIENTASADELLSTINNLKEQVKDHINYSNDKFYIFPFGGIEYIIDKRVSIADFIFIKPVINKKNTNETLKTVYIEYVDHHTVLIKGVTIDNNKIDIGLIKAEKLVFSKLRIELAKLFIKLKLDKKSAILFANIIIGFATVYTLQVLAAIYLINKTKAALIKAKKFITGESYIRQEVVNISEAFNKILNKVKTIGAVSYELFKLFIKLLKALITGNKNNELQIIKEQFISILKTKKEKLKEEILHNIHENKDTIKEANAVKTLEHQVTQFITETEKQIKEKEEININTDNINTKDINVNKDNVNANVNNDNNIDTEQITTNKDKSNKANKQIINKQINKKKQKIEVLPNYKEIISKYKDINNNSIRELADKLLNSDELFKTEEAARFINLINGVLPFIDKNKKLFDLLDKVGDINKFIISDYKSFIAMTNGIGNIIKIIDNTTKKYTFTTTTFSIFIVTLKKYIANYYTNAKFIINNQPKLANKAKIFVKESLQKVFSKLGISDSIKFNHKDKEITITINQLNNLVDKINNQNLHDLVKLVGLFKQLNNVNDKDSIYKVITNTVTTIKLNDSNAKELIKILVLFTKPYIDEKNNKILDKLKQDIKAKIEQLNKTYQLGLSSNDITTLYDYIDKEKDKIKSYKQVINILNDINNKLQNDKTNFLSDITNIVNKSNLNKDVKDSLVIIAKMINIKLSNKQENLNLEFISLFSKQETNILVKKIAEYINSFAKLHKISINIADIENDLLELYKNRRDLITILFNKLKELYSLIIDTSSKNALVYKILYGLLHKDITVDQAKDIINKQIPHLTASLENVVNLLYNKITLKLKEIEKVLLQLDSGLYINHILTYILNIVKDVIKVDNRKLLLA